MSPRVGAGREPERKPLGEKRFSPVPCPGVVLARSEDVQIRVSSDLLGGQDGVAGRETVTSIELPEGERELLDDFLGRLQAIIRNSTSPAPASADDTRPARHPRKRRS
jgi:hypothetical protein